MVSTNSYLDESVINKLHFKHENDKTVFNRVYGKPLDLYKDRLKILKMTKKKKILDAGCGFGQWTTGLSDLNDEVYSVDMEYNDLMITKIISRSLNKKNVSILSTSIEELPFSDNSFDAVFSYSVLYYTNFKKTVKEFYRVLKPGGVFYACVIGVGWCLNRILNNQNFTSESSVRKYAFDTLLSSLNYLFTGEQKKGCSIALTPRWFSKYLQTVGFNKIICAPEGNIHLDKELNIQPFYKPKYLGITNVFEVLAEK